MRGRIGVMLGVKAHVEHRQIEELGEERGRPTVFLRSRPTGMLRIHSCTEDEGAAEPVRVEPQAEAENGIQDERCRPERQEYEEFLHGSAAEVSALAVEILP